MKNLNLILLLFLAIACGGDDFRKIEKLDDFRILAVKSDFSEVVPGVIVNLQLIVSDVKGAGRVINGTTVSCIDPGIAFGAKVNCDHDPSRVTGSYTVDTNAGDLPANLYTGLASDVLSVTVPAGIWVGRSAREKLNGVGYIVIFKFNVDGKDTSAFKRVVATTRIPVNSDPSGSAILMNGAPISSPPDKDDKLKVTTSAPEIYDYMNIDGSVVSRTEEQQVAWYVTSGKLDKPKTDVGETTKYLDSAVSDPSLIIAIVRDERGGLEMVRQFFP